MIKLAQYLIEVLEKTDEPSKEDFIHLLKVKILNLIFYVHIDL